MSVVDSSAPVLPVTYSTNGYGYAGCDGLEGKDASFLTSLHGQIAHRDNLKETLETKFQVERLGRDLAVQAERLERENQRIVLATHETVRVDGEKTRGLIQAMIDGNKSTELADLKLQLALLQKKQV